DSYKVSIAYRDGFMASGTLVVFGGNAHKKALWSGGIILERLKRAGWTLEHSNVECLGTGDIWSSVPSVLAYAPGHFPPEVVLRVSARDSRRAAVERFTKEFAPLVTSGPPGISGYTTGRPAVREVFAFWPALMDKKAILSQVQIL